MFVIEDKSVGQSECKDDGPALLTQACNELTELLSVAELDSTYVDSSLSKAHQAPIVAPDVDLTHRH